MSIDDVVKLIDAIVKLLNVIIWPGICIFVLIRFGHNLGTFFSNLVELSFKGAGIEASIKTRQAEASAALAAAAARPERAESPEKIVRDAKLAADIVAEVVTPGVVKRTRKSNILWVDDRPNNNIYERQSLAALGISFTLAKSTEEALEKISKQPFDAIISDMGRPPDSQAGYTLLDALRSKKIQIPFIIYAGSKDPKHVAESLRHGAIGCTNNATELFEMVLSAIGLVT